MLKQKFCEERVEEYGVNEETAKMIANNTKINVAEEVGLGFIYNTNCGIVDMKLEEKLEYHVYERYNYFFYRDGKYGIHSGQIYYYGNYEYDEGIKVVGPDVTLKPRGARILNATLSRLYKHHLRSGTTYYVTASNDATYVRAGDLKDMGFTCVLSDGIGATVGDKYSCNYWTLKGSHGYLKPYVSKRVALLQAFSIWLTKRPIPRVADELAAFLFLIGAEVDFVNNLLLNRDIPICQFGGYALKFAYKNCYYNREVLSHIPDDQGVVKAQCHVPVSLMYEQKAERRTIFLGQKDAALYIYNDLEVSIYLKLYHETGSKGFKLVEGEFNKITLCDKVYYFMVSFTIEITKDGIIHVIKYRYFEV